MTFFKIASGNPFDGNVISDGVAPFTTNVLAFLRGQMFQERFERIVTVVAPMELRIHPLQHPELAGSVPLRLR